MNTKQIPDLTTSDTVRPVLLICPSVAAWRIDGQLWLDRKFKDGMDMWALQWPGRVRAAMVVTPLANVPAFGAYPWAGTGERFELELLDAGVPLDAHSLAGIDMVLASADDPTQLEIGAMCRERGVPCIYGIEYTFATRAAMALSAPASHFKRLKTWVWLCLNEVRLRRAMRSVDAVQANGIPAFDAYAKRKPSHHLYFDTRLSVDAVVSPQALAVKLAALEAKTRPLRLAFSGRLIAGKGADLLVPLAARLRRAGLDFRLDLYGSGELEAEIHRDIASQSLGDVVRLHAAVDFATVLVPIFQHEIDLFICCHRQGDPSCTYAETLGCGIPFVGFANESLKSMVDHHDIGWLAPMNDVDALADIVVRLDRDRPEITRKSHLARHFGLAYSMEAMFKGRVSHCSSQLRASTALV